MERKSGQPGSRGGDKNEGAIAGALSGLARATRRALNAALVVALVGVAIDCGRSVEESASAPTPAGRMATGSRLSSVSYRLDWTWGRAKPATGGRGWTTTTDRGWEVTVDWGQLSSYSLELVPCGRPATGPDRRQGRFDRPGILSLFSSRTAVAGHSNRPDPSSMPSPRVETLEAPAVADIGTIRFPAADYCQVHYLVARSIAPNGGNDAGQPKLSLQLEGSYRAPGIGVETPFVFSSSLANGRLAELPAAAASGAGSTLEVTVRRDLGGLFDGIDFAAAKAPAITRQVLTNLMEDTRIDAQWR